MIVADWGRSDKRVFLFVLATLFLAARESTPENKANRAYTLSSSY